MEEYVMCKLCGELIELDWEKVIEHFVVKHTDFVVNLFMQHVMWMYTSM